MISRRDSKPSTANAVTRSSHPAVATLVEHDPVWRKAAWRRSIRTPLLAWYDVQARELPWRTSPTPYHVWVSEVMLQQTQVATVIPYYERFLSSYPTIEALAAAEEQDLLRHWEGLGYYRRARSLHAAAKLIVADHGGAFPQTFEEVLALPGIGRYTAGAILSISADQRLPILEGNTQRVFSRWVALRQPTTDRNAVKLLWEIAESMLPQRNAKAGAGTFNQAAMELGALVCVPKNPRCGECPVASRCQARLLGLENEIPGKVTRLRYQDRSEFALVIAESGGRGESPKYLVRPLPDGARWAGLWDFPRTTQQSFETLDAATDDLESHLGTSIATGARLTTIKHAVTKYRISLHVHTARLLDSATRPVRPWRFVSLAEMADLPMSTTGRRIAKLLSDQRQPQLEV